MSLVLSFVPTGLFPSIFHKPPRNGIVSRRPQIHLVGSRSLSIVSASNKDDKGDASFDKTQSSQLDATGEGKPESTPKRKISRTEEIAAKLGKSKESLETQRDKVLQEDRLSNRKKYGLASLAVVLAVAGVLVEKFDPNSGITLLRYLQRNSAPVEIVGNGTPAVIEFSATWCENCKLMARSIFDLENEYAGRVNFVVLDADNPDNQGVADEYGVDGIPQLTLLDGTGKNLGSLVGLVPKTILSDDLNAILEGKDLPHPGFSSNDIRQRLSDS